MKGRAFAAVVLSALLLLSGLGIGGWWLLWQRGPLQLAHHPLSLPRAARFVPASAAFSLYLFSDGQRPVDYARAVAPARQRRPAGDAVARLRDGAFAAAGLDYQGELASWLGGDIAMALFEDPVAAAAGADADAQQPASGWLLALASRDDDGARRFLQRFWQTRSLAGTDLQVSRYRGMGLISGRGALLGSRPEPLATALVDDDLVLIASGRNLLERALDVSQIAELNQAGQPQLRDGVAAFASGAALAVASPAALHSWFGLSNPMADGRQDLALAVSQGASASRRLPPQAALAAVLPELQQEAAGAPSAAAPAGEQPAAGAPAAGLHPAADSEAPPAPAPAEAAQVAGPSRSASEPIKGGLSGVPPPSGPSPSSAPPAPVAVAGSGAVLSSPPAPGPLVLPAPPRAAADSGPAQPEPKPVPPPRRRSPVAETAAPAAASPGPSLLAVLQPQGRELQLRARLLWPGAPRMAPAQAGEAQALLDALRGSPTSLALIQDPASLIQEPWLRPLLERSLGLRPGAAAERQGPLPGLLARSIHGPLLVSQAEQGWQLGSQVDDPAGPDLAPLLQEAGLLQAPLELEGHALQVWTHLSLPARSGRRDRAVGDALVAPLAGWREQRQELAWWGQTLASVEDPAEGRSLTDLRRDLQALGRPQAPLQWSLDGDGARALLRAWQPWRLLSALAGGGLDGPVRGLALAVESSPDLSALELRARLRLGA